MAVRDPARRTTILGKSVSGASSSGKKALVVPATREQCQLLINLIAESDADIQNIHVGKTLVFYRAPQNRSIERLRRETLTKYVSYLQKNLRGMFSRKLVKRIRSGLAMCLSGIKTRDLDEMDRGSTSVLKCIDILKAINKWTVVRLDFTLGDICKRASSALLSLDAISIKVGKILLDKANIFQHCDELQIYMDECKQYSFTVSYRNYKIDVSWDANPNLVQANHILSNQIRFFRIKNAFDRGFASNEEFLLQAAISELQTCRDAAPSKSGGGIEKDKGPVLMDENFCREEEKNALEVLAKGRRAVANFVQSCRQYLVQGSLQKSREGGGTKHHVSVTVDASPLSSFLSGKVAEAASLTSTSTMLAAFVSSCQSLADLRAKAQAKDWKGLWLAINASYWLDYLNRVDKFSISPTTSPSSTATSSCAGLLKIT
jgi:hypothetical protein